jgi:hypothetical protein
MSSPVPRARPTHAAFVVLVLLGCSRRVDDAAPAEPPVATPRYRELASSTAFELAPAPTGALLAWVRRGDARVQLEWLDGSARLQGRPRPAPGPSVGLGVADLVAVATDSGVALAWSEASEAGGASARAAWVSADGAAQTHELGAASRAVVPSRGGLALAARGDGALVFARGADVACVDASDEACVAFNFFQLSAAGIAPAGIPLSVPSPCDSQAAQLNLEYRGAGSPPGAFDYAVCSNVRGSSSLTIFSIRTSPAYAMSREAFTGCTPLGAARFGGQAAFVAACGKYRRLAMADARTGELDVQEGEERGLICRGGAALVRFGSTWLRLVEPLGRLELLLSEALSPPGSRAVWTGQALAVARIADAKLVLSRYGCEDGDGGVVELPVDTDAGR